MRVSAEDLEAGRVAAAGTGVAAQGAGEADEDGLGTLSAVWGKMNERHRFWGSVVENLSEKSFADWPLLGPRTAVWPCRRTRLSGGKPTAFFCRVARDMKMAENDRSARELEVLLNVLERAGTVDQLNVGNLASMELVGRRIQLIRDELRRRRCRVGGLRALHGGLGRRARGIAPALQSRAAAGLKGESEVDQQRDEAREARKLRGGKPGGGKDWPQEERRRRPAFATIQGERPCEPHLVTKVCHSSEQRPQSRAWGWSVIGHGVGATLWAPGTRARSSLFRY